MLICATVATIALDKNYCIKGNGKLAPEKLEVFRRGKNYIFSLKSSKPAKVTIKKQNKNILELFTQQNQYKIISQNNITVWSIPDSLIKINDKNCQRKIK